MKKISLNETREFNPLGMKSIVLHDSEYFKILNFNLVAGALFPVHSHELEGQLSILVLEGEGEFLGDNNTAIPASIESQVARVSMGPIPTLSMTRLLIQVNRLIVRTLLPYKKPKYSTGTPKYWI